MSGAEWTSRLALAMLLTTCVCVPTGLVLLRVTGVPATYPPLLPQQVLAGTLGGSLMVAAGYALLTVLIPDRGQRHRSLMVLAFVLCLLSWYLPLRLSYTLSPRFAGVTLAAQVGQALLHTQVVFLSVICFLSDESGWA